MENREHLFRILLRGGSAVRFASAASIRRRVQCESRHVPRGAACDAFRASGERCERCERADLRAARRALRARACQNSDKNYQKVQVFRTNSKTFCDELRPSPESGDTCEHVQLLPAAPRPGAGGWEENVKARRKGKWTATRPPNYLSVSNKEKHTKF